MAGGAAGGHDGVDVNARAGVGEPLVVLGGQKADQGPVDGGFGLQTVALLPIDDRQRQRGEAAVDAERDVRAREAVLAGAFQQLNPVIPAHVFSDDMRRAIGAAVINDDDDVANVGGS